MSVFGIVPLLAAATAPGGSDWIHLGEPFTIDSETPIQRLVEHSEQYHNKDVRISGIVASVCNEEGCFIEVVPKNGEGVMVNFPGLKTTFPLDCGGREAVVEGRFYQKIYPSARMSHWQHHSYRKGTKIPRFALIQRMAARAVKLGGRRLTVPVPAQVKGMIPHKVDLAVMEFEDEGFGIGKKRLQPGGTTPERSTRNVREMIICVEGSVTVVKLGSEPVILAPGEMAFILPATTHEIRNESHAVASYIVIYARVIEEDKGHEH